MVQKQEAPEFSVIVPAFNRARFIRKAIDSVLSQSFDDYEIIVVDDGSTDATQQVLARYGPSITTITQPNSGVSAARNTGIEAAKGTWIAFLDSDDEWKRDYLLRQMDCIITYPGVVAFITNAINIHPGGASHTHFQRAILDRFGILSFIRIEKPFRAIMSHSHWFLQSTVVRRDVLLKTGLFNTNLTIAEDLDLIARLSLAGPFGLNKEVLVEIYRRTETNRNLASQRGSIPACMLFQGVFDALRTDSRLTFAEQSQLAKVSSANQREIGNLLLAKGETKHARARYRAAMTIYPSVRSIGKYLASLLPREVSMLVVNRKPSKTACKWLR